MQEQRKTTDFEPIIASNLHKTPFNQEGLTTVVLTQKVTNKVYYTKNVINTFVDNIFTVDEFSLQMRDYTKEETRTLHIQVPEEMSLEDIQKKLDSYPEATIYKILSNYPIISEQEQALINNVEHPLTTDDVAERQLVRHGAKHKTRPGFTVYDENGKVQYRRTGLSLYGNQDKDLRDNVARSMYLTKRLKKSMFNK